MMMGALMFWIAIALGLLVNHETTGRPVPSHQLGAWIALAMLATTSVRAWHLALEQRSLAIWRLWLILPALILLVLAMVSLSGTLSAAPFSFSTITS